MNQVEYFGIGSIDNLPSILEHHSPQKIFLVTGKSSYAASGAEALIGPLLASYDVVQFSEFENNPKLPDIKSGIKLFCKEQCDLVLAVGGGSVIDIAKSINVLAHQVSKPEEYVRGKNRIEVSGKPLITIPTTAGTGSEATHFAVVYIGKEKFSLAAEPVRPSYSIIDPRLTFNLSSRITAETGMDAFSQAIESYWSVRSTEESKRYSAMAINLILSSIVDAVNSSTVDSKVNMAKAANLAGKAIDIAQTTACHAISYPLTSYFNIPHGHAAALTLASILSYNSKITSENCQDPRGEEYVKKTISEISTLLKACNPEEAADNINQMMKDIRLETRLSSLGISSPEQINLIIKQGFNPERVKNNPRKISEKELRKILEKINQNER